VRIVKQVAHDGVQRVDARDDSRHQFRGLSASSGLQRATPALHATPDAGQGIPHLVRDDAAISPSVVSARLIAQALFVSLPLA